MRAWHRARIVNGGPPSWEWRAVHRKTLKGSRGCPASIRQDIGRRDWQQSPAPRCWRWRSSATSASATSRIKDLANIEGVRQNQLIGYGLVVGLNGTGDTLNNIPFTKQSLQAMLERMGVNIRGAAIRTGNVAAVMVTGNLPAFGTQGTRMDVTVSALGDAKNLQGGTLLVTPLLGADGNVYAVAQGSVAICGFAGRRRRGQRRPRRADRRPYRQRRHHRARDRIRAEPSAQCAAGAAQRRFHHRQAHCSRRQ